jgi:hypothetical protein
VRRYFINTLRVLFPAISLVVIPVAACQAWCGWCGCGGYSIVDGHTKAMWARTWHGPNALATPLTPYFIPRTPASCSSQGGYGCGADCEDSEGGISCGYGGRPYPAAAAVGFDPAQFERLGRVPNEMDIVGALGAGGPGPAPVAAPRR